MGGGGSSRPRTTSQERSLAKNAANEWSDYVQRYIPAQNEFLRQLEVTPGMEGAAHSQVHADARIAQGGHAQQMHAGLSSQGVAPGAGRSVMARGALESGTREASGLGGAAMAQGLYDREIAGKTKMTAFGRGLTDTASLSTAQAGQRATSAGISAMQRRIDERNNLKGLAVGAAGMGAAHYMDGRQSQGTQNIGWGSGHQDYRL